MSHARAAVEDASDAQSSQQEDAEFESFFSQGSEGADQQAVQGDRSAQSAEASSSGDDGDGAGAADERSGDGADESTDPYDGDYVPPADDDDEDGESDGAQEVPEFEQFVKSRSGAQMANRVLALVNEEFFGSTNLRMTREGFAALQECLYERVWLPIAGFVDDEDDKKKWAKPMRVAPAKV
jgi:hypothetical protein